MKRKIKLWWQAVLLHLNWSVYINSLKYQFKEYINITKENFSSVLYGLTAIISFILTTLLILTYPLFYPFWSMINLARYVYMDEKKFKKVIQTFKKKKK